MNKKILITGNLGYLGSSLIPYLQKNTDYEIYGYDIGWFEDCKLIKKNISRNIVQIYKDIRDLEPNDLRGIDSVIHLCAVSNDPMGKEFEIATKEINIDASIKLAKLCSAKGIKNFVFASSCSVYGAGGVKPKKENDKLEPLTAYAKSKIIFENALKDINLNSEMLITCLRFSTACGPSPRIRLDLVLNDFVASAIVNNKIDILSNGSPLRPLIDVEDICRAIHWALVRKVNLIKEPFLIVNVGRNDNNLTVLDMAKSVIKCLPNTKLNLNKEAENDKRSYAVDFSFYKKISGDFYPKFIIQDSIRRLISQMTSHPEKLLNFREGEFIRHNVLRSLKNKNLVDNLLKKNENSQNSL